MDESKICFVPVATSFLLGIITVLLFYWYSKWNHDYWKKRGIPYVEPTPLFGSVLEIFRTPPPYLEMKRYSQLGPLYGYFERSRLCLSIGDPKILKHILVKDFYAFSTRREFNAHNEVLDNMLISLKGEHWKRIRTIWNPAFTSRKLKWMIGVIKECSKTLITNMKETALQGNEIDVKRMFGAFAMDVIASTAFSTKIDSHNNPDNKFVKTARYVFEQRGGWRFLLHLLFPSFANFFGISIRPADTFFFKEMTLQIIEERKRTGQVRNDFLQMLIDTSKEIDNEDSEENQGTENDVKSSNMNKNGDHCSLKQTKRTLTENELVGQCVIFFLAGYEPTHVILSYATYCLALNPQVQEKLRQEVDGVLKQNEGELTYETLSEMKYLDNVILETLRMYPPVARTERVAEVDYESPDVPIKIPKGTLISVPIYAIHRDPLHFPDPDRFDPERFNPEERVNRDPYTYLPFLMGPRGCVAMRFGFLKVKACLVAVVSAFVIKACPRTKVPLDFVPSRMLTTVKELIVQLEPREKTLEK